MISELSIKENSTVILFKGMRGGEKPMQGLNSLELKTKWRLQ